MVGRFGAAPRRTARSGTLSPPRDGSAAEGNLLAALADRGDGPSADEARAARDRAVQPIRARRSLRRHLHVVAVARIGPRRARAALISVAAGRPRRDASRRDRPRASPRRDRGPRTPVRRRRRCLAARRDGARPPLVGRSGGRGASRFGSGSSDGGCSSRRAGVSRPRPTAATSSPAPQGNARAVQPGRATVRGVMYRNPYTHRSTAPNDGGRRTEPGSQLVGYPPFYASTALANGAARRPPRRLTTISSVELRVLGPLEVVGPDGPIAIDGRLERALLAYLVAHLGRSVPADELVDALWGIRGEPRDRGVAERPPLAPAGRDRPRPRRP